MMVSQAMDLHSICSVDDLLVQRANEETQAPLVAYPRSVDGLTDFTLFTAKDLDSFTDAAAKRLLDHGMRIIVSCSGRLCSVTGNRILI